MCAGGAAPLLPAVLHIEFKSHLPPQIHLPHLWDWGGWGSLCPSWKVVQEVGGGASGLGERLLCSPPTHTMGLWGTGGSGWALAQLGGDLGLWGGGFLGLPTQREDRDPHPGMVL